MMEEVLGKIFFYVSYLAFPFAAGMVIWWKNVPKFRELAVAFLILSCLFVWGRFVEPHILIVKKHELPLDSKAENLKIAVFSDQHFGIFKNTVSMKRVVARVNKLQPDLVLIPGDFLYHLPEKDLKSELEALKDLEAPAFAVTGNHDVGHPGPNLGPELRKLLPQLDVTVLDNGISHVTVGNRNVTIVGLKDLWEADADYSLLDKVKKEDFVILLTHNPDTAFEIKNPEVVDLMVSGHTHGGQIRIPFLYKLAIPNRYSFDYGFYEKGTMMKVLEDGKEELKINVFVTSGIGMTGLPMRFFIPPRIDLLEI